MALPAPPIWPTSTAPPALFDVTGRTVAVTGGARGLGASIAAGLARAGAQVFVTTRSEAVARHAETELRAAGDVTVLVADCSSEAGCRTLAAALTDAAPRLHVLINNAGSAWGAPLDEHDTSAWRRVLDLNLEGVFHMTRFLAPVLRVQRRAGDPGRVINIGSIDGTVPPAGENYAYAASKAAVHHLTRQLAQELAPDITVNAIAPGVFESRMTRQLIEHHRPEIERITPMRRLGAADDIVGAVVYLASPAGSFVTGAVLPVDGGLAGCPRWSKHESHS